MSKKSIFTILFIMVLSAIIVSLYSTFAYDEESTKLDYSTADYNLIYSMRESTKNQVIVTANETKFVDITLRNDYQSNVKYGIYYHHTPMSKIKQIAHNNRFQSDVYFCGRAKQRYPEIHRIYQILTKLTIILLMII